MLLKILAKLFISSFFMKNSCTPILKKVKKCKVSFISPCFVYPVFKVSSKTCAVLYHGNVSFQIKKFTVECQTAAQDQPFRPPSETQCARKILMFAFFFQKTSLSN